MMNALKALSVCVLLGSVAVSSASGQANIRGGSVNGDSFGASDQAYVERFRSIGANSIRLFFDNGNAATDSESQYRAWIDDDVLPKMDELVAYFATEKNMKVLISLPRAPGGRVASPDVLDPVLDPSSANDWMRDLLVETWGKIALRYNALGNKVAYQMFSEPAAPADTSAWMALQKRIIDAIRDADSTPVDQQPTIFYMTLFGDPSKVQAINLSARRGNMGILGNMYHPFNYTHQQTPSARNANVVKYPNCAVVGAKKKPSGASALACSKPGLEKALQKFIRFAKKNNLVADVSEIAVSRRAPGAARYLDDVFKTFKKLNIGWYYFTFTERGDSPWRLNCTDSSGSTCVPTALNVASKRQAVVEKFFAQLK